MTDAKTWPASAYQAALAVLAATCPGACPAETQAAWRVKLAAKRIDPAVVMRAVDRLTDTVARPSFADLLTACQNELRGDSMENWDEAGEWLELPARATEDPDWEAAGYTTLRRFAEHLGTARQRFDFDAEHRAEYERRKAAGGE